MPLTCNCGCAWAGYFESFEDFFFNGVGVADVHGQLVSFNRCTETDTNEFKIFLEAFRYADYHVVQQSTGCSVAAVLWP